MKSRFNLRAARRRAVLRMLNLMSSPPKDMSGGASLDPQQFNECQGRAHLIGPGTFLVAVYLQRMQRESLCKKKS
jgi:hypothetical protein